MRFYLLGVGICLLALQCGANPIVTVDAEPHPRAVETKEAEVEKQGVVQEETPGVFKGQSGVESAPKTEQEKQAQTPAENSVEIQKPSTEKSVEQKKEGEVQAVESTPTAEVSPSTEVAVKKTGKAKGHKKRKSKKLKGRQSSDDDDDDDDEDDDDLDLGVEDDDDDDEDDEDDSPAADDDEDDDDDDDGDYFERFFDDILGGGDDDDDDDDDEDDDVSPSTGSDPVVADTPTKPVAQPVEPVQLATAELTPAEELDAQEQAAAASADLDQGALQNAQPKMPAIYISKYNRFVDNIISRISRILGKSYDPVRVKLQSPNQVNKAKKKTKVNNKQNPKGKKKNAKRNPQRKTAPEVMNKMGELPIARAKGEGGDTERLIESETREPAFVLISKTGTGSDILKNITVTTTEIKTPAGRPDGVVEVRQTNKKKNTIRTGSNNANRNKNKAKQNKKTKKNKPKAKATLFGLSTMKRDGNVAVNMMADHTMVKTNFVLGPLTLRVEREIDNKGRRELKSATATTEEMYGRLNLKIIHGGAATLHSLRVLQPKQVRVDSPDDHDKTREFIWKRSAHIASMVSQKLSSAARSMLKPMGK